MQTYLSIDVGTTNWKVAAFDIKGNMVAIKKTPTKTIVKEGMSYFDPLMVKDSILKLIKDITTCIPAESIRSIAVTGMAESFVLLDNEDKPLNDALAWFDNRPAKFADIIKDHFSSEVIFEKTGLDVHPVYSLSKLMFLTNMYPDILKKTKIMLQMPEYITYCLAGRACTDYSLASRTMLLNINTNEWDKDLLEFAGLNAGQLPSLMNAGSPIGQINKEIADITGLPESTLIAVGGHDHPCATISTGVALGNSLLDSSGTAESFLYVSKENEPVPKKWNGLRVCRFLTKDKFALWGGIPSGGVCIEWGMNQLKRAIDIENKFDEPKYSYQKFCEYYLKDFQKTSNGLFFLPYLRGAGAPYWDGKVFGGYLNLSTSHTNKDMLTAIFEALGMHTKLIIERMSAESKTNINKINTVGGGSRLRFAQEIKAEICQADVNLYDIDEGTLAGCAFLGAIATKDVKDIDEAVSILCNINSTVTHKPSNVYDEHFAKYKTLYGNLHETLQSIK